MQPQDAFEELARITLADNDLVSVMTKIALVARDTVDGADEVSVTLVERQQFRTVAFTGQLAVDLDERQYAHGYGPCLDCIRGGDVIVIPEVREETRWSDWVREAEQRGVRSTLSIPVPLRRDVGAGLNIYSTDDRGFDDSSVEVAQTIGAYAGVALANMHLYDAQARVAEQLEAAMRSRAVIEQAKGIVMAQRRCGADDAFQVLVARSQEANRKLRDIAQEVVDEAARAEG